MTLTLKDRTRLADLSAEMDGEEVTVAGWIQDVRDLGGIAFVQLRDGLDVAQIVLPKKKVGEEIAGAFIDTHRESVVALKGKVQASDQAPGGFEVLPTEVEILNQAEAPLPMGVIDKVDTELETRIDNRFMDVRNPEVQAIFRVRAAVLQGGRTWFSDNGFTEIHSPNIIGTASEGGTDVFKVQYFEDEAYLSQSPQLYKQTMMATGIGGVFEVAKYFRAERHNTTRHLNESTAFDCEVPFIDDEEDVLWVLEHLVQAIWQHVADTCTDELDLLGVEVNVPETPFPRVTYDEAIEWTQDQVDEEVPWGEDLSRETERVLGEIMAEKGHDFYFITKYPEACKPFYAMPDGELSRSFDLGHKGMEVTSGAQRVHDPAMLEERLKAKDLEIGDFDDYLKPFKYGMPPHGGFGLGIERLVMELLGLKNVREAVLFPRDRTRLSP